MSTDRPRILRPSPSLQDLVAQFGRYDLITDEAWAQFHAEMARWMEDVRAGRAEISDTPDDTAARTPGEQAARDHVSAVMQYRRHARRRRGR